MKKKQKFKPTAKEKQILKELKKINVALKFLIQTVEEMFLIAEKENKESILITFDGWSPDNNKE